MKFLLLIVYLFSATTVFAQFTMQTHNAGWVQVQSYNGKTTEEVKIIRFHLNGESSVIPAGWSLQAKLNGPVTNSANMSFPVDKIKLRINKIQVQNGLSPTIGQIGAINSPVAMNLFNVPLIPNSPLPLTPSPHYQQYQIYYDIIIDGGAYLQNYKSWQNYTLNFIFTVTNTANATIATWQSPIDMQVYPTDNPPIEDTYSLSIQGGAKNVVLEFKTMQDYTQGVEVEYPKALSVVSNTDYVLSVRASHPEMYSQNNSLSVDVIKLKIKDTNNETPQGTITLSAFDQSVLSTSNPTLQPRLFDINYFTVPNNHTIIQAPSDNYSTTLFYTLTPQ